MIRVPRGKLQLQWGMLSLVGSTDPAPARAPSPTPVIVYFCLLWATAEKTMVHSLGSAAMADIGLQNSTIAPSGGDWDSEVAVVKRPTATPKRAVIQ